MARRKTDTIAAKAAPAAEKAGSRPAPSQASPPPVEVVDDGLPPPDIRGRRLDHPRSETLKAELLGLDPALPLTVLIPDNDREAAIFAEDIRLLLAGAGRSVAVQPVRFDPPFRGLQLHEAPDRIQLAIGHR